VAAAMLTVPIAQALSLNQNSCVKELCAPHGTITAPADVLRNLDQDFPLKQFKHFFSVFYLVLNIRTGELRYAKGGHPEPMLVRSGGAVELLQATGPLIGMNAPLPFEEQSVTLQAGDRVFLYTDGITECFDAAQKTMYGEERLKQTLTVLRAEPLDDVCRQVINSVMMHAGRDSLGDDCTLVALEYLGTSEHDGNSASMQIESPEGVS
jgi:sigma-B regulation protein RsbU (phosphoserine phosphatase)